MRKYGSSDFMAFVNGGETEAVIQSVVSQYWPKGIIMQGGTAAALQTAQSIPEMPRYVVVDLEGCEAPETEAARIIAAYHQVGAIVFIGERNDVAFYRSITRLGAGDYLVKPFDAHELYSCLINAGLAKMGHHGEAENNKARMISFVGARGGVGTSGLMVNAGWILAEEHGRQTALVDLDVHFGTIALSLDVEPSIGFRDALESPNRIDSVFIESALVSATPRLSVLAAEESLDSFISYNNTAIEVLLEKLRENREFVLVDTPRTLLMRCEEMMAETDVVVIVSELTVSALRDTVTIVNKVKALAADMGQPNKEIRIVVNKEKGKKAGQITLKDFEKEVEMPVSAVLPDMPEVACVALNDGKPMVAINNSNKLVDELRNFCNVLDGKAHSVMRKDSMFKKLLGTKA